MHVIGSFVRGTGVTAQFTVVSSGYPGFMYRVTNRTSQVSKYKRVSSVFLGEVSADASDQQRDQLGEAGELSGEEGVAVLRL